LFSISLFESKIVVVVADERQFFVVVGLFSFFHRSRERGSQLAMGLD
jgi:hypothetical protein